MTRSPHRLRKAAVAFAAAIGLTLTGANVATADVPEIGQFGWVYRRTLNNAYTGPIFASPTWEDTNPPCTGTFWHATLPGMARTRIHSGRGPCWGGVYFVDYLDSKTGQFKTASRQFYPGTEASLDVKGVGTYLSSHVIICGGTLHNGGPGYCSEWIISPSPPG